jgi:hypothetical protein
MKGNNLIFVHYEDSKTQKNQRIWCSVEPDAEIAGKSK